MPETRHVITLSGGGDTVDVFLEPDRHTYISYIPSGKTPNATLIVCGFSYTKGGKLPDMLKVYIVEKNGRGALGSVLPEHVAAGLYRKLRKTDPDAVDKPESGRLKAILCEAQV